MGSKTDTKVDTEQPLPALSECQTFNEDEKVSYLIQQDPDVDDEYNVPEQRKIIHKVDRRLLILLGCMQAVSFLDRANIANAAVAGMEEALGLEIGNRYSIVLIVFYPLYICLQFPASILVRKVGPRIFLSTIVLLWGIVMICFAFAKSWKILILLRILVGGLEAGCFPSQYYLISSWYSRYDLYKRTSIFYLIGVLGSALSGVLALGFSKMDGLSGRAGWQWIFIMEGIITCLIENESAYIIRRINRDRQDADLDNFSFRKFLKPALDAKVWAFAMIFLCTTMQAYSIGYFLPVILETKMGYSTSQTQGLSTPPYIIGMILMFVQGWLSDKIRLRYPFLYFNAIINIVGLCLMVWASSAGVEYFGAILVTAGSSANLPTVMVFQSNNIRGAWKRAFCSASMIGLGGTGGIVGSLVFRSQDAPKYLPGIYTCLTANGLIVAITTVTVVYFLMQNKLADKGLAIIERLPSFRYTL
ncbi:uncharacterized protein N7483_001338 [Penicillium malachiteum]|uniref:uncharacterized protein n=1 Tax=Penicillium malachiteum TaxID=1324776 RepID=UPI002547581D|nr:uncharacterized protein N7483_001338 [Penicillium malachiteum]KAJ5736213.1 hypothetical protein N7483_001338 [Penicillium malachiteum]